MSSSDSKFKLFSNATSGKPFSRFNTAPVPSNATATSTRDPLTNVFPSKSSSDRSSFGRSSSDKFSSDRSSSDRPSFGRSSSGRFSSDRSSSDRPSFGRSSSGRSFGRSSSDRSSSEKSSSSGFLVSRPSFDKSSLGRSSFDRSSDKSSFGQSSSGGFNRNRSFQKNNRDRTQNMFGKNNNNDDTSSSSMHKSKSDSNFQLFNSKTNQQESRWASSSEIPQNPQNPQNPQKSVNSGPIKYRSFFDSIREKDGQKKNQQFISNEAPPSRRFNDNRNNNGLTVHRNVDFMRSRETVENKNLNDVVYIVGGNPFLKEKLMTQEKWDSLGEEKQQKMLKMWKNMDSWKRHSYMFHCFNAMEDKTLLEAFLERTTSKTDSWDFGECSVAEPIKLDKIVIGSSIYTFENLSDEFRAVLNTVIDNDIENERNRFYQFELDNEQWIRKHPVKHSVSKDLLKMFRNCIVHMDLWKKVIAEYSSGEYSYNEFVTLVNADPTRESHEDMTKRLNKTKKKIKQINKFKKKRDDDGIKLTKQEQETVDSEQLLQIIKQNIHYRMNLDKYDYV